MSEYILFLNQLITLTNKAILELHSSTTQENEIFIQIQCEGLQQQLQEMRQDLKQLKDDKNLHKLQETLHSQNSSPQIKNNEKNLLSPNNIQAPIALEPRIEHQKNIIIKSPIYQKNSSSSPEYQNSQNYDSTDLETIKKIKEMKMIDLQLGEQLMKQFLHEKSIQIERKKRQQQERHSSNGDVLKKKVKLNHELPNLQDAVAKDQKLKGYQFLQTQSLNPKQQCASPIVSIPEQIIDPSTVIQQQKQIPKKQKKTRKEEKEEEEEEDEEAKMTKHISSLICSFVQKRGFQIEEIKQKYKNILSENQILDLIEFGKQVLEYLKIRKFVHSIEAKKDIWWNGEHEKLDILAINEKEALIIELSNRNQSIQDIITLDYQEKFLNQIETVEGKLKNKKVTLMILPLGKFPIEFVEYTFLNIQEAQMEQYQNPIFQQHLLKLAEEEFNKEGQENILNRQFTDQQNQTKSIGAYAEEMKEFLNGKDDPNNSISQFLTLDQAKFFLSKKLQKEGYYFSAKEKKNRLINFFILHLIAQQLGSQQFQLFKNERII